MPDQELLDDFLEALETARSLKNLPGSWSDLALACLIHVGMKRLTPDQDSGLGVEAEYQEAVRLAQRSSARPPEGDR
jgi:hypothetical protein